MTERPAAPRAETAHGVVEGLDCGRYQSFRGIPFARPPVGALRLRAPEAPDPWPGVLRAVEYGPDLPQVRLPGRKPAADLDEGRLVLHIDTPCADSRRRPVLVWIHGGQFAWGSASRAVYDGGRMATRADVVVVRLQYRLGALGYMYLAELGGERCDAACNAGQLDQIAALRWIRENIAAFGGDPANVTLFGESAGASAIAALLAMPAARGLFGRVILQSGAARSLRRDEATQLASVVLEELSLGPSTLEQLWNVPADEIVAAQLRAAGKMGEGSAIFFAPVVDGESLPLSPLASLAAGEASEIALVVGTNLDEFKAIRRRYPLPADLDMDGVIRRVARVLPGSSLDVAHQVVEIYRRARQERGTSVALPDLVDAIETDAHFRIPAIRLAEAQCRHQRSTYMYLWTWASPAWEGRFGACHGIERPFVFGTLDAPGVASFVGAGPDADRLSLQVMDLWTSFGRTGRPAQIDRVDWQPYDAARRHTLELDRVIRLRFSPLDPERLAWEGVR
jgi:para-nitrobenzyl esterase